MADPVEGDGDGRTGEDDAIRDVRGKGDEERSVDVQLRRVEGCDDDDEGRRVKRGIPFELEGQVASTSTVAEAGNVEGCSATARHSWVATMIQKTRGMLWQTGVGSRAVVWFKREREREERSEVNAKVR